MGNAPSAEKPELQTLRENFDGNVLLPDENKEAFESACETWHTNPLLTTPRRPRLVLQPRSIPSPQILCRPIWLWILGSQIVLLQRRRTWSLPSTTHGVLAWSWL